MATINDLLTFELKIDFEKGKGDPSRVFSSMASLIESIQALDEHLIGSVNSSIRSSIVLEEVEKGSVKAILRKVISEIPDDTLKSGEIKPIIGHFVHKATHRVLDWCGERDEIVGREEVKELEQDLLKLAKETDINNIPAYTPVETQILLTDINSIQESISVLEPADTVSYTTALGDSEINKNLVMSNRLVREMVTKEIITNESVRILKVKKPDYLGYSQWSFKQAGHQVEAKILDIGWLKKFHAKEERVHPGDSLRVLLIEEISYGYDSEIVYAQYEIKEVLEVIEAPRLIQEQLNY